MGWLCRYGTVTFDIIIIHEISCLSGEHKCHHSMDDVYSIDERYWSVTESIDAGRFNGPLILSDQMTDGQ